MAYATYTTRAIVCGSKDSYTSDRSYLLFTEDAGMLFASARSVRTEASKQRYALVDFSIIKVSLVKGRSGWKIGSVEAQYNPFLAAAGRDGRGLVTNLLRLIRRYVHGEEPVRPLFSDLVLTLSELPTLHKEEIVALQLIFTLRLLHTLGYVVSEAQIEPLLRASSSLAALPHFTAELKIAVESAITIAEQVSHL